MLKQFAPLALLGLCLASATMAEKFEVEKASTPPTSLAVCAKVPKVTTKIRKYSGPCYISETKTVQLSAQMASVIQAFNIEDKQHTTSETQVWISEGGKEEPKAVCSKTRIKQITANFAQVASQLWSFASGLRNVSEPDVLSLDEKKEDLIERLRELQVFTGLELTPEAAIVHTFESQVSELEQGLNSAITQLKSELPARPAIKFKPMPKLRSIPIATTTTSKSADQLVSIYAGSLSNFDTTLEHIQSMHSLEQQVQGYLTLYEEMAKHSHLDTYELTRLLVHVKQTSALPASAPTALQSQFTKLKRDYSPFMSYFSGEHTCGFKSVALNTRLFTGDPTWPEYTLLYQLPSNDNKMKIVSQNGGLTFRILSGSSLLYATPTLVFSQSKRYIVEASGMSTVPANAWKEWKLVPVSGGSQFKILNAQHNEVMFVDPLATHHTYQRAFLKRYDFSGIVDMPANGDLWILECQ